MEALHVIGAPAAESAHIGTGAQAGALFIQGHPRQAVVDARFEWHPWVLEGEGAGLDAGDGCSRPLGDEVIPTELRQLPMEMDFVTDHLAFVFDAESSFAEGEGLHKGDLVAVDAAFLDLPGPLFLRRG